jgi:omega-6 fatty acid desaturase (delta-12 desaturase)
MQTETAQEIALLKQLPNIVKSYQRPDYKKAIFQMATSFLPFMAIWTIMYFTYTYSFLLTLGLAVLNAFFLVRIFIIQHDCGHQSFTASRKFNNIVGKFASLFSLIPYQYWAKSHNFHHGHNGILWEFRDIGDIHTLTVNEFKALNRFEKLRYMMFRNFFILFVIGPMYYILFNNRLPLIKANGFEHVRRNLIWSNVRTILFILGIGFVFGFETLLYVHLPIIWAFGIIAIWFFYVQHQHETTYKQWKERWEYIQAAIKGSSYYKLPKLVHWLTGNIGYHHIHHLNPLVPNYELAKCHHENPVFEKLANTLTFWQSLKCIFHKLWDEEQQRMISVREYFRLYSSPATA